MDVRGSPAEGIACAAGNLAGAIRPMALTNRQFAPVIIADPSILISIFFSSLIVATDDFFVEPTQRERKGIKRSVEFGNNYT